jgi:hypothetical protein
MPAIAARPDLPVLQARVAKRVLQALPVPRARQVQRVLPAGAS